MTMQSAPEHGTQISEEQGARVVQVAQALLSGGADPTITDQHGNTAAAFAHANNRNDGEASELLRAFGFTVDASNVYTRRILHSSRSSWPSRTWFAFLVPFLSNLFPQKKHSYSPCTD